VLKISNEIKDLNDLKNKVINLSKDVKNLTDGLSNLKNKIKEDDLITIDPDLNADGKISPGEMITYKIFKTIIEKTQKHALLTNLMIAILFLVSVILPVLGLPLFS